MEGRDEEQQHGRGENDRACEPLSRPVSFQTDLSCLRPVHRGYTTLQNVFRDGTATCEPAAEDWTKARFAGSCARAMDGWSLRGTSVDHAFAQSCFRNVLRKAQSARNGRALDIEHLRLDIGRNSGHGCPFNIQLPRRHGSSKQNWPSCLRDCDRGIGRSFWTGRLQGSRSSWRLRTVELNFDRLRVGWCQVLESEALVLNDRDSDALRRCGQRRGRTPAGRSSILSVAPARLREGEGVLVK
jgi:hypothetical protein